MTKQQIAEKVIADTVSKRDGVFTVRRGFFYTGGGTAEGFANHVKRAIPAAVVVDYGEVWKPFIGSAPVAKQSHWFVKFTVKES